MDMSLPWLSYKEQAEKKNKTKNTQAAEVWKTQQLRLMPYTCLPDIKYSEDLE